MASVTGAEKINTSKYKEVRRHLSMCTHSEYSLQVLWSSLGYAIGYGLRGECAEL